MRWLIAVLAGVAIVAGCGVRIPDRVAPTLDALRQAGLRCGEPQKDNVPSGLLEWSCDGLDHGAAVRVLVDGDEKGVFDLTALVPASAGTATAREVFVDVVDIVPAFAEIRPASGSWLRQWTGAADHLAVGRGFLSVDQSPTSILLSAFPGPRRAVGDPI